MLSTVSHIICDIDIESENISNVLSCRCILTTVNAEGGEDPQMEPPSKFQSDMSR